MRFIRPFFCCFLFVFFFSCFGGIDKPGSIKSYDRRSHIVLTHGEGGYRIGRLSADWQLKDTNWRALLFQNRINQSTITVSSWCKEAFNDDSLGFLSRELYHGLQEVKIQDRRIVSIEGYNAQLTALTGEMDGRPVYLKTYVMKKNACLFDFVYVTVPGQTNFEADFDSLVRGFHYLNGPDIL